MSVGSVLIGLQATRRDGQGVTTAEFLTPLAIRAGEVEATRADGGPWTAGMVYFAVVRYGDFDYVDNTADAETQSEAFFAAVVEAFRAAGRFLDQRSSEVIAAMRAVGLSLQIFVEVRMDEDQMELEFPPELLAASGRHGLGLYIISNDIPAHELWAARQAEPGDAADSGGV